jgi:hypothetical protein
MTGTTFKSDEMELFMLYAGDIEIDMYPTLLSSLIPQTSNQRQRMLP